MQISNFKGYCKSCPLRGFKVPDVCALFGIPVSSDDYCSKHRSTIEKCSICGAPLIADVIVDDGHLICPSCFESLRTCKICRFGNTCEFETNPSSLPKIISKQIRQGNMTAVTQVMNPERVRITCEKGCKCYSKENGCLKQIGTCNNQEVYYGN